MLWWGARPASSPFRNERGRGPRARPAQLERGRAAGGRARRRWRRRPLGRARRPWPGADEGRSEREEDKATAADRARGAAWGLPGFFAAAAAAAAALVAFRCGGASEDAVRPRLEGSFVGARHLRPSDAAV
jgi:hypothetical protein